MHKLTGIFICFCLLAAGVIYAQEKPSVPNSLNSGQSYSSPTTIKKEKKKKIKFFSPKREDAYRKPNVKNTARYEYYVRIEKAAKQKQRILKELSKPQYSDFRYFGHKKIPKRRAAFKMKYCDECGIRH
jgi:hypothetical protein